MTVNCVSKNVMVLFLHWLLDKFIFKKNRGTKRQDIIKNKFAFELQYSCLKPRLECWEGEVTQPQRVHEKTYVPCKRKFKTWCFKMDRDFKQRRASAAKNKNYVAIRDGDSFTWFKPW